MNTRLLFFLFLFIYSTLISSSHSKSDLCNPNDKKVLLKIKKDLKNPYVLASWNPDTDCCDWYCVKCHSKTKRIYSLNIFSGDLDVPAQIPAGVGDLPYLETLTFHKLTNLTGPIQPAISKLKNLKYLDITWTSISGPVPDFLSKLDNLIFLHLSFNNLSGSIPSSLSKLKNLSSLRLDRNKLTGQIPESFGSFNSSNGMYIDLSHNQLFGKVPSSLGKVDFTGIDLSRNKLEGDISFLFGLNKTAQFVDYSRNMLEFNMSNVEFSRSLMGLDLNHNKIFGSIPVEMTSVNFTLSLQFFNVSYNRLCGQIPIGGKLQSFDYSAYFHNRCLCGAPLDQTCK